MNGPPPDPHTPGVQHACGEPPRCEWGRQMAGIVENAMDAIITLAARFQVVMVNRAAFTALDKATQDAVLKAAADAEVRGLAASKRVNTESLEKLKAGGMQIVTPSAQLKADMMKVGETMLAEWLDKAGPDGKALVDAFRK